MSSARRVSTIASAGTTLGAALLLTLSLPALAAGYPPGGYPGPAPAGAFPTVEVSQTVGTNGGTMSVTVGSVHLDLAIPASAFPQTTQVTIYQGASAVMTSLLPSGERLLFAYAVGWTPASTASLPLTLTIADASIPGDAVAYETTSAGLTLASESSVASGSIALVFSSDPGFVVAAPASSPTPTPSPSSGTSAPTPTTGAGPRAPAGPLEIGLAVAALGVLLAGGGLVTWRRRAARAVTPVRIGGG